MRKWLPPLTLLPVLLLLALVSACSSTSTSLEQQVVTAENSAQLADQAKQELSYQDYELMKGYVERVHPDVAPAQLPVGMTIATMIEAQKAYLAAQGTPVEQADSSSAQGETPAVGGTDSGLNLAAPPSRETAGKRPSTAPKTAGSASRAQETARAATPSEPPPPPPPPTTATLGAGTEVVIRLSQSLSSRSNQSGQSFEGILEDDLKEGGHVLAPAGATVTGKITQLVKSGKVKGKAQMSLTLTALEVGGESYRIDTNTLSFEAQGTGSRDAKRIGIASGIGAVVGAIAGGGKGAAIGAAVGAGAGTGVTLATPGDEVEFPTEQRMSFKLDKTVELPIIR